MADLASQHRYPGSRNYKSAASGIKGWLMSAAAERFSLFEKISHTRAASATMHEQTTNECEGGAMLRGGVFIGVNRTTGGQLPTLRGAAAGAKAMYDWAVDPHFGAMNPDDALLLTDAAASAEVAPDDISTAVLEIVDRGVDQLIVYFSGHGMIIDGGETWLLSRAPLKRNAAISIPLSIQDARSGRTPHVVIISDACRTPAKDLQGQRVIGESAFPNYATKGRESRVDVFYATGIGQAALELNTAETQGIYTEVLRDALTGKAPSILEPSKASDEPGWYVWSGPLGEYLEEAVADRLIQLEIDEDQTPTFDIQYGRKNLRWLARILELPAYRGRYSNDLVTLDDEPPPGALRPVPTASDARTISQLADALLSRVSDPSSDFDSQLEIAEHAPAPGARSFMSTVRNLLRSPDSLMQQDPSTIVRVRGTTIRSVTSADPSVMLAENDRVAKYDATSTGAPVIVEFANRTAAVLPILPRFVTEVVVVDREILAVSFDISIEASDPLSLFAIDDGQRLQAIRRARALSSASARHGRFQIASNAVGNVVRPAGSYFVDPTIWIYAAYSSNSRANQGETQYLSSSLTRLAGPMFDVAMLAGRLSSDELPPHGPWPRPRPFMPLLTKGWDLLPNFGLADEPFFDDLRRLLIPSLWTVFESSATDTLIAAEVFTR